MQSPARLKTLLVACLAALPLTLHAQAPGYTDWNAGRDLALNEKPDGGAQESANPNATVPQWSYGYRTGITNTDLTLFTAAEHVNATSGNAVGAEGFSGGPQNSNGILEYAAVVFPVSNTGGVYGNLAAEEIFSAIDNHSPDGNNVIRWTCPADGAYSYRVSWRDLDGGGGDGAAGYLVVNGAQKFKGTWPNGSGQGASTTGTLALKAGDVFDVLLNANSADSSYDSTGTRIVIVPGSVVPAQSLSLPLATSADGKLDLGAFNGGATVTLAFSGNGDLVDSRYQTRPDGSLYAPAAGSYDFANAGATYPTQDGGDGINHFAGGGANYDATGSGYGFATKLTTDTTDPAAIRLGAVVGTFSASPVRGDWFLIGNGVTVTVPAGGAHLYVAVNDTFSGDNHSAYTGTVSTNGDTPNNGGLVVPGTANPFLSGLPAGTTASGGDDSAPAQSPVLVPGLTLNPNRPLNFAVTGSVSTDAALPPTTGPDGGAYFFAHDAENGFPKIIAPINSLVGVFLSDAAPDPTSVNGTMRDFSDPANGGVNYLGYQPRLAEAFFIGDGQTSGGALQNVFPPAGATRLFLGVLDGNDYFNNLGQFNVVVTPSPLDASDVRLGQDVSSPTSSSGASALIGDRITYTFHVKNVGSRTLTNVVVKDVLPGVLEPVDISDGGTFQGGVVTWTLGSLAPTGASVSKDLTLVVRTFAAGDSGQNVAAARVNQVINNLDYFFTGDGLPPAVPGLDLNNSTVLKAPVDVAITSNASSATPGTSLTYTVALRNDSVATIKKPSITLALPEGVKFDEVSLVDKNGNAVALSSTDGVHFTSTAGNFELNGGQLGVFTVGKLKPGESVQFLLTVQVPYDVPAMASINLGSARLMTKTSDGNGQNSFGIDVPDTQLSGVAPTTVPELSLLKFVPDPVTIVQAIALESLNEPAVGSILSLVFPGVNDKKGIDKLKKKVNPDVIDAVAPDGSFEQDVTAGSLAEITYALVYRNSGTGKLKKAQLQDRVPDGTQYVDGSAQLNGVDLTASQFALVDDNRTLLFNLGNLKGSKPGKPSFGIVTYKVRVSSPDSGGVAIGKAIQATGGALNTPSLLHTTFAYPEETDVFVVPPEHVTITSKQYNATPTSDVVANPGKNNVMTYDVPYKVDGGVATQDLLIVDTLPKGATNISGRVVSGPVATVDVSNEQAVFHLGALARKTAGVLRVQATLGNAALEASLAPTNSVGWVESANATRSVVERPVTRRGGKITRLNPLNLDAPYLNVAHFADPGAPKLIVSVAVPLSVKEGETYDYLIAVSNPSDSPVFSTSLELYLPGDAEFVSADQSNAFQVPYDPLFSDFRTIIFPAAEVVGQDFLLPHSSQLRRVTPRAPKGSRNKVFRSRGLKALPTGAVVIGSHQLFTPVASESSGQLITYVYPDDQPFGNSKAQVLATALAEQGLSVAEFANRADYQSKLDALDIYALGVRTSGGDCITFNNTALLVPIGQNQVLSIGGNTSIKVRDQDKTALMAGGGNMLISQDGSGLIAAGAGNLIRLTNLVAAGAGNLVGPEGTDFTSVLNNLVAAGAGNLIAAGAGNLVAAGAGNLISQDGSGLIGQDGTGLIAAGAGNFTTGHLVSNADGSILPTVASALVASNGLALAAGRSSIISQDGTGLVAAGAGNLVAAGAGNLVAAGAGNLVAAGAGNVLDKGNILRAAESATSFVHASSNGLIAAGAGN